VEDFRRDGRSVQERRLAKFGGGWVRSLPGEWSPLVRVRFTADATPLMTIDAAVEEGGFILSTGGETKNTAKLGSELILPDGVRTRPEDLPAEVLKP
jgi:hypothetical protein